MNIIELSILSAGLSVFVNYIIGKPGSEFSPYEIFSDYTVWLSKLRLKNLNLYYQYKNQFDENLQRALTNSERKSLKTDYKKLLYDAADPFFTWERATGMCIVCTGFWIAVVVGLCFTNNYILFIENIVFSHVLIRILNKIL